MTSQPHPGAWRAHVITYSYQFAGLPCLH